LRIIPLTEHINPKNRNVLATGSVKLRCFGSRFNKYNNLVIVIDADFCSWLSVVSDLSHMIVIKAQLPQHIFGG
jgi:hypothetical protein